jgi:hypothetical protein
MRNGVRLGSVSSRRPRWHQLWLLPVFLVTGCAAVDFDANEADKEKKKGLVYYEPKPYLLHTVTDKCVSSVTVVSIPAQQRRMKFKSGYGAATLSASFSNGVITAVGQATDTKVPETIAAVAGALALTSGAGGTGNAAGPCDASATLYPLKDGVPDTTNPTSLPIDSA